MEPPVSTPLIAPGNVWALLALIVAWIAVCIRLEQRYRWAAKISGPVLILIGSLALSNASIIPERSPVYDVIQDYIVPVCIPLLLFRANIVVILRESGWMFLVFHLSAIGTCLGAVLAGLVLRGSGIPTLGEAIAIMTGSYTGGSVNFMALKNSFPVVGDKIADALIVADNLIMTVFFLICFSLPSLPLLRRIFRSSTTVTSATAAAEEPPPAAEYWKPKPISLLDIAQALAIAVTIAGVSHLFAGWVAGESFPAPPLMKSVLGQPYLVITALCVLVASLFSRWLDRIAGAEELGTYLIYLFFFVIGAPASVRDIFTEVPLLFVLCAIMATTNLAVTLILTLVCGRTIEEAALAVNATLGGAPSAAAMAIAKGWRPLVLPSILVGIWGYVIGTYLGFMIAGLLAQLL